MLRNINKDELFSAIKGLNIRDYSIKDLQYLMDLFKIKSKQIETEIMRKKRDGEE